MGGTLDDPDFNNRHIGNRAGGWRWTGPLVPLPSSRPAMLAVTRTGASARTDVSILRSEDTAAGQAEAGHAVSRALI